MNDVVGPDGLRRTAFNGLNVKGGTGTRYLSTICFCVPKSFALCCVDGDAAGFEVLGDVEAFLDGVDVVLSAAEGDCGAAVEGHPVGVESAVADLESGF